MKTPFRRDIASASPALLKGALHEAVLDANSDVIALCGEDGKLANLFSASPKLLKSAKEVMELLHQHGKDIVPHLLDTDENAGQRLREAIAEAEGSS